MRHSALILGFLALSSQAQAHLDPYLSFGVGAVFPGQDINIEENSNYVLYGPTTAPSGTSIFQLPNIHWHNDLQTGVETNLIVGFHLPHHLRLEGEFFYQNMERDMGGDYEWVEYDAASGHLLFGPEDNTLTHSESTVNVFALMSNLVYDFTNCSPWTPTIGAGFGIAWINSDSTHKFAALYPDADSDNDATPSVEYSPELYGTAFAWQFKAGLNYAINHTMSLDIMYRLFGTTQFEQHKGHIVTNGDDPTESADFLIPQGDVNGLLNNSVYLNFRYTFR